MATYRNGICGAFSGKVGNLIGSSRNGESFVRKNPQQSSKPKTEKQIAQQAKFGLAVRFLTPIRDLLNISFRQKHMVATGYNLTLKHTLKSVIVGTFPNFSIDYEQVQLSTGTWAGLDVVNVMPGIASLIISWSDDIVRPNSYCDDRVHILMYQPENNEFLKGPENLFRMREGCVICLPEHLRGKTLHIYLFAISTAGRASKTFYAGEAIPS